MNFHYLGRKEKSLTSRNVERLNSISCVALLGSSWNCMFVEVSLLSF